MKLIVKILLLLFFLTNQTIAKEILMILKLHGHYILNVIFHVLIALLIYIQQKILIKII